MNHLPNSCRPKHQVLVLKCYPKVRKRVDISTGVGEGSRSETIKPNPSELSYLLYYANARRSKLTKVADFLEKRTVSDVGRGRIAHVQITLQILKSLVEKTSRDLQLYAGHILRILRLVLQHGDITLIESSLDTWASLAGHQDPAVLSADQEYMRAFEEVVQLYSGCASKDAPLPTGSKPRSFPQSVRFRKAGLQAIQSLAESECFTAESGRQLTTIMPVLLQNVFAESGTYLRLLEGKDREKEEADKEAAALKRRQSIATVRTGEEEADPAAAIETTEEADRIAEEAVGVKALQALKTIFGTASRALLRLATDRAIAWSTKRIGQPDITADTTSNVQEKLPVDPITTWYPTLFEMTCWWAPVQDRFVVIVTVVEAMRTEPSLETQYILSMIVAHLLSSTVSFIGLSVMDVLLSITRTAQSRLRESADADTTIATTDAPSSAALFDSRERTIAMMKSSIANLATHVYYRDQVEDMISAILRRMKPSSAVSEAIPPPQSAVETTASLSSFEQKDPSTTTTTSPKPHSRDGFFHFPAARSFALGAIELTFGVALRTGDAGSRSNKIGMDVWLGTEWLLHDPDWEVRKAYVTAFLAYVELESSKCDLRIFQGKPEKDTANSHENGWSENINGSSSLTKRAVSNSSKKANKSEKTKTSVLARLHLAIFDGAHELADSESDVLLLHLLLAGMVFRLGTNAVVYGLPMIFALQEEVQADTQHDIWSAHGKKNVASLCHGYFWTLASHFEFDASATGREILDEVNRRRKAGSWMENVQVPPLFVNRIPPPASITDPTGTASGALPVETGDSTLKPFRSRAALADKISEAYRLQMTAAMAFASPPSSPPRTPSAHSNLTASPLGLKGRSASLLPRLPQAPPELPAKARQSLMDTWSKEVYVQAIARDSPRSGSMTGSASATAGGATAASGRSGAAKHHSHHLALQIPNDGNQAQGGDALQNKGHHRKSTRYSTATATEDGYGFEATGRKVNWDGREVVIGRSPPPPSSRALSSGSRGGAAKPKSALVGKNTENGNGKEELLLDGLKNVRGSTGSGPLSIGSTRSLKSRGAGMAAGMGSGTGKKVDFMALLDAIEVDEGDGKGDQGGGLMKPPY
ncbi:hypothetical protein K402DRAFT_234518 [Aulographum hederae CBS 113979]|uniref:Protein EFR3 n=1 Tax=Aulographum hederae CBS 113979 TaxID=1176131 RepID=A0A6G1GKJ4_9PEZI|nr:hypothetical protein K402DRAFT_234518 [Aulographum hederae CBS 113979]